MQRSVLLGAGAAVLIVGGGLALRAVSHHQVTGTAEQAVDHELADLLSGASITHGPIVEDGLTGTATVHDLVVARPNGESWTAATMVLSGVHAAALRDVFDSANYPNGHPAWTDRRKLVGDVTLNTVRVSMTGAQPGELTIDKAELHGLRGRPFATPPTPQNRAAPGFAADAALAFAYDSERITGLAASVPGPSPFKMTLATAGADGYDSGKLASLDVKSLAAEGSSGPQHAPFAMNIGAMGLKGADASGLLAALQTGDATSSLGKFSYGAVSGSDISLKTPQGPVISIHDFKVDRAAQDAGGGGHGTLTGLTIGVGDMPMTPDATAKIAAFGMNAITTDITVATQRQADGVSKVTEDLDLHDLGSLHVTGSFTTVATTAAGGVPTLGSAMVKLMGTTIQQAKIVWDDRSLTSRIFKMAAESSHTTPAALHQQLAMPIMALGVLLPDQPDAATQLTHFLDNPHQLTVTINPASKLTLGQVAQAPATERAHLLGVRISSQ